MKWPFPRILLVVLGFTAFSNAIFLPFVHDDIVFILKNPDISSFAHLLKVFIPRGHPVGVEGINFYYRPLLEIFYRLEYQMFNLEPAGYHLLNVLIHLSNGLLLFALLKELKAGLIFAWFVAALFLVHPVQTEAVSCVSGISNLLSTLFLLAGLFLNLRVAQMTGKENSRLKYSSLLAFALSCYALALLTKESSVVLFGLVLLTEGFLLYGQREKGQRVSAQQKKSAALRISAFLAVTAGYFLWRAAVLNRESFPALGDRGELVLRIKAIPHTLVMYLQTLAFPLDLHYYRNIDILQPLGFYPFLFLLIILGGYVAVRCLPAGKSLWAIFGVGWFMITIFPVLNFIPLVNEYSLIAAFEHFLYLPCAGFIIFVLAVVDHGLEQGFRFHAAGVRKVLLPGVLIACLFASLAQNRYWQGEVALFERMAKFEKSFGRGWGLLAQAYYSDGEYVKAIEAYQKSLAIMRSYYEKTTAHEPRNVYRNFLKISLVGLANSYEQAGELEEATQYYLEALGFAAKDSRIYNSLGVCYIKRQRWDKAQKYFEESLRFGPQNTQAMNNLAICYIQGKRFAEAQQLLQKALGLVPQDLSTQKNLEKLHREIRSHGSPF